MSGGKVKAGGTNYSIQRGKAKAGGTNYTIYRGMTMAGGTNYRISFLPLTYADLMATRVSGLVAGSRNSNTTAQVTTGAFTAGYTYWVFSACSGYLGIHRLDVGSSSTTKTTLISNSNGGGIVVNNSARTATYAQTTTATAVYGCTMIGMQFNSTYKSDEIDYILKNATYTRLTGRNTSSAANVYTATSNFNGKIGIILQGNNISIFSQSSSGVRTLLTGNNSTNPILVYESGSNLYVSTTGTSAETFYGASMISVTPK